MLQKQQQVYVPKFIFVISVVTIFFLPTKAKIDLM